MHIHSVNEYTHKHTQLFLFKRLSTWRSTRLLAFFITNFQLGDKIIILLVCIFFRWKWTYSMILYGPARFCMQFSFHFFLRFCLIFSLSHLNIWIRTSIVCSFHYGARFRGDVDRKKNSHVFIAINGPPKQKLDNRLESHVFIKIHHKYLLAMEF